MAMSEPIVNSTNVGGCTTNLSFFEVGFFFKKKQEPIYYSLDKGFPKF